MPKRPIESYEHSDKDRANNPPVGLVTPGTDRDGPHRTYAYDPHLDPSLHWAGKAEHTSFAVPTVSLHVHERIDPCTIIEAVRRRNGESWAQLSLFGRPAENPPLREAIEFYRHRHNWSNRLIAGDSLLVMNSLLEKEGLAGQVQMIYIDPPYGITYGSNFQPFVNKRDVKDGKDEDLTAEPEQIRAFRDTWELGIHSYLTYLRDRLLLARELLTESGSIFVQISDENVHHVRELMDEVFGVQNFCGLISFVKSSSTNSPSASTDVLSSVADYIIWFAKDIQRVKYHQLFREKHNGKSADAAYRWLELSDGTRRDLSVEERNGEVPFPPEARLFTRSDLTAQKPTTVFDFEFEGRVFSPLPRGWRTTEQGMRRLAELRRLILVGKTLRYVQYLDDYPVFPMNNVWADTGIAGFVSDKVYVVQTNTKVVERCLLMATDPGDLVLDSTCGSGTTAYVAEQWGRRWITCDTSRVAVTLTRQRLMTAAYDYYELAQPTEGVGSGFRYRTVPHVTLKSIANNEPPGQETLYDQPCVDTSKTRVSGPFTVEAVPAPVVRSLAEISAQQSGLDAAGDASAARSGETLRQLEWRDELRRTGIRGRGGQKIEFFAIEALPGTRWLHASADTKADIPQRAVISFGPAHAPLEQRQVELALEEAQRLLPRPALVVFAAFQFDPEAARDIDETQWPGVTLLKVQMNADLLTDDLKKSRASNESFWLIGQPDVRLTTIKSGAHKGKCQVEVLGFDYYDPRTGVIESGGTDKIALWLLDTDYDGRSLFPRQVFFPLAGEKDGWARLARSLRAEIDEDLIEAYRGTVSLPFEPGRHARVAVKIVDDRGIESLKVIEVR